MASSEVTVDRADTPFTVELPAIGHHINGEVVRGSGPTLDVVDPARGSTLTSVPLGNRADVDSAVHAAREAFPAWSGLTPRERSEHLHALADAIAGDMDRLRTLEALNCGKPAEVTEDDVVSTIDTFRFMAGAGRATSTPAAGDYVQGTLSIIVREPLGVVGLITPWNYPLLMAAWKLAPALMAGNTVVLKPSEVTPLTTLRLAELAAEVLPRGVINVVLGEGDVVGEALGAHPDIDMVALTGSVRAGSAVAETASAGLKRVHLELGGKAPVVVCADADLDAVAETVADAGYWNSGQECGAACRVLAHDSVAEELSEKIVAAVSQRNLADPEVDADSPLGPMISHAHFERVTRMLAEAVDSGAEVLLGGGSDDSRGFWIEPTVLRAEAGNQVTSVELFGPVVSIETFSTVAEGIERANDTEYGLTGSVFTRDVAAAVNLAKALDFGSVNINTHLPLPTEMPWGGFKRSGYGRDLSAYALDDFCRTKHLAVQHAD
ncbi:MAG: aldehyde dehydrogenase family protein [Ornithinimicrobium sp.]